MQNPKGGIKEKMNTIRKIRKNAKALSPVVASIILIAVTVAVSIAVAAWMGGMTIGFMGSSSVTFTNVQFTPAGTTGTQNTIDCSLKNTGTKTVTIAAVRVNNQVVKMADVSFYEDDGTTAATSSLDAGATRVLVISGTYGDWQPGNPYKVDLYDGSNQVVGSTQQNAPGA